MNYDDEFKYDFCCEPRIQPWIVYDFVNDAILVYDKNNEW